MEIQEIVICEECKGTGRVRSCPFRQGPTPNCETCKGSGRQIKTIVLTPFLN